LTRFFKKLYYFPNINKAAANFQLKGTASPQGKCTNTSKYFLFTATYQIKFLPSVSRTVSVSADSLFIIPQPFLGGARTTPQAGGRARLQNFNI